MGLVGKLITLEDHCQKGQLPLSAHDFQNLATYETESDKHYRTPSTL